MEKHHVIVATDGNSGNEAMYIDGDLVQADSTIYACDIAEACKGQVVEFSHVNVELPEGIDFPSVFDSCMQYLDVDA